MKFLTPKKLLLIGFIVILLIAIPITIWFIGQQQQTRTQAQASTVVAFEPVSSPTAPIEADIGETVALDIFVDPGTNQNLVSFVRLEIQYDPSKLATGAAIPEGALDSIPFQVDATALTLLEGPLYSDGKISATLSVGADPTQVIQTRTKIATISFTALEGTGDIPTEVSYTSETQVLSTGSTDQFGENVLSSTTPAYIAISGDGSVPTATPTEGVEPSVTLTTTPTPSVAISTTPTPSVSETITPSPTGISTGSSNQGPSCTGLTADRDTTGDVPFSLTFTSTGTDPDGTINQVTFSFGDGQVQNVTEGGGIGTNTINTSISHTYETAGTYQASVVLTDDQGAVSDGSCTIDINATSNGESVSGPTTAPEPTLPPTGAENLILGLGAVIGVLTAIGAVLFFIL